MGYKKLAIIGNGFDIAHNLKTTYNDFYAEMSGKLKNDWENLLVESKLEKNTWTDFEKMIDKLTDDWFNDSEGYFFDIANNKGKNKAKLDAKIDEISDVFKRLTEELQNYLTNENKREVEVIPSVKKNLDIQTKAITFNYTDTANLYLNDTYHIHGSLREDYIVLGYKLRVEHTGMPSVATKFFKTKLRELLNFKRYLARLGLSSSERQKYESEFTRHLDRLFTGKGGYCFDYSEETNHLYQEHLNQKNVVFSGFQYFGEPEGEILRLELEERMREERCAQISKIINDYGEQNNFLPFPIVTGVNFNEIEELVIMGHSLEADEEIVSEIIRNLTNLNKVKLFIYKGESDENIEVKESLIRDLSIIDDVKIERILY
ncbi:AbiH family protein [Enterococcus sp. AZ007]|uniref:AbiH family protein n=1 Tax=Enterococcus sp. AZ007 TaxID=2774839 RepID=UPI003F20CB27